MQKTLKHDRQNNGGKSSYDRVKGDLRRLFERNAAAVGELADSIFEYWENEYIYRAADLTWEPCEENQNRLAAYLAFIENSDENQELISDSDWEEFGRNRDTYFPDATILIEVNGLDKIKESVKFLNHPPCIFSWEWYAM